MRRLIYVCVFHNPNFIRLLLMLLESISLWGKCSEDDIDILIYTTSHFQSQIDIQQFQSLRILFAINDRKTSVEQACEARLDIFDIPIIAEYEKILYLDTDILVLNKIGAVFDVLEKDVLYAVREGSTSFDCWGRKLFEGGSNPMTPGFNSGVMLFRNSFTMKTLFQDIRRDIVERAHLYTFMDQPFIVHHAIKNKLYDNHRLRYFVQLRLYCGGNNRVPFTDRSKTIIHFLGGVGATEHKEIQMRQCLTQYRHRKN